MEASNEAGRVHVLWSSISTPRCITKKKCVYTYVPKDMDKNVYSRIITENIPNVCEH